MQLRINLCRPDQLGLLTQLARQTFREAFEEQNNPEDFSIYINTFLTANRLGTELKNPDTRFYLVSLQDDLVGYFKLNEQGAQTEVMEANSMELERIYVLGDFQGRSIGSWMLRQAIAIAREKNKSFLWLGVWEHNREAIRFYQREGFEKFGEHPYYIGSDRQMDWLMRLDLVTLETA